MPSTCSMISFAGTSASSAKPPLSSRVQQHRYLNRSGMPAARSCRSLAIGCELLVHHGDRIVQCREPHALLGRDGLHQPVDPFDVRCPGEKGARSG